MNYHSDHRVQAARKSPHDVHDVDTKRMIGIVTLCDDNGDEEDIEVPLEFEVCPTCNGKGTHVNPSIDYNGLSAEDFAEDPDFVEEYFSGRYDVACYGCNGNNVVAVIADTVDTALKNRIDEAKREESEYQATCAAERRMGA